MDIAGIACRRDDDTICLKPIEEMDTLDLQRMAPRGVEVVLLPASTRDDGRRFQSFSYKGPCPFCKNLTTDGRAHNNNFYHYVNINGVRVIKAFPASNCKGEDIKKSGIRIDYRPESLAAYQDAFDRSLGVCSRELSPAETARVMELIRSSCRDGRIMSAQKTARAWWDSAGCGRLSVRLQQHYVIVASMGGIAGEGLGRENEACRIYTTKTPWTPVITAGEFPGVKEPVVKVGTMDMKCANKMRREYAYMRTSAAAN